MFRKDTRADDLPAVEDIRFTDPAVPSRSCCCPARPVVKVTMPAATGRSHPVDLWLCGHHYRASIGALLAVGADVKDLRQPADAPVPDRTAAPV